MVGRWFSLIECMEKRLVGERKRGAKAWGEGALWNLFFENHAESEKGFSRICTKAR